MKSHDNFGKYTIYCGVTNQFWIRAYLKIEGNPKLRR